MIDVGAVLVILALTHATHVDVTTAAILMALFMALVAGRFVVAIALVTDWVDASVRASFLSFNSAFQHLASGFAALLSGLLLKDEGGKLVGYPMLGWVAVAFSVVTALLLWRRGRAITVLAFLVFAGLATRARADFSSSTRADISAYWLYRDLNQNGLSQYSDTRDQVITAQVLEQLTFDKVQFEFQPEILYHHGDGVGPVPPDPATLSMAPPNRPGKMSWQWNPAPANQEAYFDLERLVLAYQSENFQAYLGRKPVSLGVLKLFPVWNKFTRPSPVAVGPEAIVFGQDGGGLRTQFGEVTVAAATEVQGPDRYTTASIGEVTWFSPDIEVHLLGAEWWQANVAGLAFSKDLFGATIRAEGLYIGPDQRRGVTPPTGLGWRGQIGGGVEYAFTENLSGIGEVLWQQNGAASTADYTLVSNDPFQILRARAYSIEQLKYKVSNFLTLTPTLVGNWVDYSQYILFSGDYSFNQSTDLILTLAGPLGGPAKEFSVTALDAPTGARLGAPAQVSLALATTF